MSSGKAKKTAQNQDKAKSLEKALIQWTGRPLALRINANRHNLVVTNRRSSPLTVSVHEMFLDAPREVLGSLAEFLVKPSAEARRRVREYIAHNSHRIAPPRVSPRSAQGRYYDLEPVAARLNKQYFGGKLQFQIFWGRRPKTPPRRPRHVTLGTCLAGQRCIRINPILDQSSVPPHYLDYIVYHEMAHLAVPSRLGASGKLAHHTPEFYAIERRFALYAAALAWQDKNIHKLLDAWCRKPGRVPARRTALRRRSGQLDLF